MEMTSAIIQHNKYKTKENINEHIADFKEILFYIFYQ